MMTRDKIAFWHRLSAYADAMALYLDRPPGISVDYDRLIKETEAEVWAMVDRFREESD